MISADNRIISRLSGNQVLVAKKQNPDDSASNKQKAVEELKSRDKEVRNHEAAHSTNPELIKIGSAQFDYTIGPDGKAYATGGKITLSTGNSKTPEEALSKAEALKKASMAPGEPSSQDFQALNAAVAMEFEARNQIYSERKKIDNGSLSLLKGTGLNIYA
jgi:hypothetical protein